MDPELPAGIPESVHKGEQPVSATETHDVPLPPVVKRRLHSTVQEYWLQRVAQHTQDWYANVPISKFPEDLRVYEHLLWVSQANVVIELGTQYGGSTLWFRDRLRTLVAYGRIRDPLVISVDLDTEVARQRMASVDSPFESICLISGDLLDPDLPAIVERHVPPDSACMVVEDSAHIYETTTAALRGFARFVPVGGFFVVEDGCVDIDEMRLRSDWPRGVLPALQAWLSTTDGRCFRVRSDLELYGISCHPGGFLQRVGPAQSLASFP